LGYARMVSPSQEERWQAWGYPNLDYNSDNPLVLGGAKPFVKSNKLTRDGLMGVFEYEPDDALHMVVDVYYSKFSNVQRLRGIEIPGQWGAGWGNSGVTPITVENGLVTEGVINDAAVVVRNDVTDRDVTTWSAGWNAEYQVNDEWSVEGDIAYSKVDRTLRAMESYAGTGRGNGNGATDEIGFKMTDDGSAIFSPGLDYSDPNVIKLGGPFGWGNPLGPNSQDGFINKPVVKDELSAIRLSAERQFEDSAISSVEIGTRYSTRDKSLTDNGFYLTLKGYLDDPDHMLTVPDQYLLEPTSLDFFGMGPMLSYDSLAFYDDGGYIETDVTSVDQARAVNTWKVKEKVFNVYVQTNIDTEFNGNRLTGNIGVQAVHTDQSSEGRAAINDNGTVVVSDVTGGDKYWTFLPSANLSLEVAEDTYLRIAGARVMARAPMDKMNASRGFNYNATNASITDPTQSAWSGWGGNPELRPWMATQFDMSFETYFGEGGYVAMAAFYKKLQNIHFDQGNIQDFTGATIPEGQAQPATFLGSVWSPTNGEGGGMYGFEFSTSLPGSLVSESLDGFGVLFSASLTKASVRPTKDAPEIDMPGLSETVLNGTLYYEKHGFQARVSARHRSDFLGQVSGLSLANDMVFIKAETIIDAQIGYDFTDHGIDGLSAL
ncbi:MAG: TonB-dependent receptor, partial [Emcibacter sp.]|nr:TonB-dependent receptor [Emcibacter sp.]